MSAKSSHVTHLLRRPWTVWLALCLALLGALAPTLSHALNWASGGQHPLIEICTSTGPRWMVLPAPADQADRPSANRSTDLFANSAQASGNANAAEPEPVAPLSPVVLDHCPFCMLMADRMAPPAQPQPLFFAAPGNAVVPASPPAANLSAQVIAAAHPRGPPAP